MLDELFVSRPHDRCVCTNSTFRFSQIVAQIENQIESFNFQVLQMVHHSDASNRLGGQELSAFQCKLFVIHFELKFVEKCKNVLNAPNFKIEISRHSIRSDSGSKFEI